MLATKIYFTGTTSEKRASHERPVVAHISDALPVPETFVWQYLKNLQAFQSILFIPALPDELPGDWSFLSGVYSLEKTWRRWTWDWLLGRIDERVLRRPPYVLASQRILARHHTCLVHAHFGPQGVWALPVKRATGLPLVTTFYGFDMSMLPKQEAWCTRYYTLFAEGDLFLVEGPHMQERLVALGCPSQKVQIQHIAVNLESLPFRPRRLVQDESVRILLCGRLVEKKGIANAIRAIGLVVAEYSAAELRIIGHGPLRPQLESMVQDMGIQRHVQFLGQQPYDRYREELQSAHILLAPSVIADNGDSEGGAPTVLLEAQACGLPIVTTYHADIPYVVRDGESALLAPERDPEALARHLLFLLRHPERWEQMGRAGREWVRQRHDIVAEARKLEDKYVLLLEQRRLS